MRNIPEWAKVVALLATAASIANLGMYLMAREPGRDAKVAALSPGSAFTVSGTCYEYLSSFPPEYYYGWFTFQRLAVKRIDKEHEAWLSRMKSTAVESVTTVLVFKATDIEYTNINPDDCKNGIYIHPKK